MPGGWIHDVFTTEDTVAISGTYFSQVNITMQFEVNHIEEAVNELPEWRTDYFRVYRLGIPGKNSFENCSRKQQKQENHGNRKARKTRRLEAFQFFIRKTANIGKLEHDKEATFGNMPR